jgi:hypothetical protein
MSAIVVLLIHDPYRSEARYAVHCRFIRYIQTEAGRYGKIGVVTAFAATSNAVGRSRCRGALGRGDRLSDGGIDEGGGIGNVWKNGDWLC